MKVLGLDLGTASIGWAVIDTNVENPNDIQLLGNGSRIIQYDNTKHPTSQPVKVKLLAHNALSGALPANVLIAISSVATS